MIIYDNSSLPPIGDNNFYKNYERPPSCHSLHFLSLANDTLSLSLFLGYLICAVLYEKPSPTAII